MSEDRGAIGASKTFDLDRGRRRARSMSFLSAAPGRALNPRSSMNTVLVPASLADLQAAADDVGDGSSGVDGGRYRTRTYDLVRVKHAL
jgi:hypothetical protein